MTRVLIVDDDPGLRRSVGMLLESEGYEVVADGDPAHALEAALRESYDLILCDVRMPGLDGMEFLQRYRARAGEALVIMTSAYGGEDAAIAAMKVGAYDYVPKPFKSDELLLVLRKAEEREHLRDRVASLEAELARLTGGDLIAESAAMRHVLDLATRVAPHGTTVLVTGESGSGKEVIARAVHRMSPRREGPFVAVNCGAIPETLLESELFGHAKGAFTGAVADRAGLFEEAHHGTLLLDEIGELPPALQVKLLRVLQEREVRRVGEAASRTVDVRVIAATARDLATEAAAGRFREDLLYRLNVVHIAVPPLRDRIEDLPGLVTALLARLRERSGREIGIAPEALHAIYEYSWPGNVRELENALERSAVLSPDGLVREIALTSGGGRAAGVSGAPTTHAAAPVRSLRDAVEDAEREAIVAALAAWGGNRRAAARTLGISVRSLFYRLGRYGLG